MERNVRYPIEAFGLAMVLFSTGMKEAMLAGVAVVFGHVLMNVLADNTGKSMKLVCAAVSGILTAVAIVLFGLFAGVEMTIWQKAAAVVIGILIVKHGMDAEGEADFNDILLADALSYGAMVLVAIIREYIASGTVFTMMLKKNTLMSGELGRAMIALAVGGIALGLVNRILDSGCAKDAALWVCIPVIILEAPYVAEKTVSVIVGMILVLAVYLASRTLLKFSDNKEEMEGVPVEMVLLGLIYLVAAIV
ncbi:MAG: hypothetical protein Q4B85_00135 [Lachnospiraceae bacterium]|nr:hypothetical protein [Lachnospiraceae bacterium]